LDLITLGNICVDIFVPAHEPPPPGGITLLSSLNLVPGGNGANTAITAARLQVETGIAGLLGDDVLGRFLKSVLDEEKVDTALLRRLPGKLSPATLVFNDPAGERSFVHHPGTNAEYRLSEEAFGAPCKVFHFAAPELLSGFWPDGALEAAKRLKAQGKTLTLDTFAVEGAGGSSAISKAHRPLLAFMDMVFPNQEEARLITGEKTLRDMAAYFHDAGVRTVAIKRGERGAAISWDGNFVEVPTAPARVVDTCGAGDNFSAGFLKGHLRGLDPLRCAQLGCALGTLCVEFQGSTTGTESKERVQEILKGL
jgi:ribokinase